MRCPACSEDRDAGDFIAGLCLDCFSAGKPLPIGSLEPLTTRTLVRVGRGLRDTVKPDATRCTEVHHREEVEPMTGGPKACRYCGKVMPSGSLFRHEHVMCEKRPANGDAQPARGEGKPQPKVQRPAAKGEGVNR